VAVSAFAAIGAPAGASGAPAEQLLPNLFGRTPQTRAFELESGGFECRDAGIGPAGAVSLLCLGTRVVAVGRRGRRSQSAIG
jgi:hypothetical protein